MCEQVLRIKHLLLVEGLTLAGARRRIERRNDAGGRPNAPGIDELIGQNARERLTAVKRGLRSILDLLAGAGGGDDFELAPPVAGPGARAADAGRACQAVARQGAAGAADRGALPPGAPQSIGVESTRRDVA